MIYLKLVRNIVAESPLDYYQPYSGKNHEEEGLHTHGSPPFFERLLYIYYSVKAEMGDMT